MNDGAIRPAISAFRLNETSGNRTAMMTLRCRGDIQRPWIAKHR